MLKRDKLRKMLSASLGAALTMVLAQLTIPLPSGVPVTMQTLAVAFVSVMLGAAWGSASVGVYLLLGAVGLPVFAGLRGGMSVLLGPTGGFLWGFVPMALLCGLYAADKHRLRRCLWPAAGILLCHLCGVTQYALLGKLNFLAAFLSVSAPFLVKDALSVAGAILLSIPVKKALPNF